MNEDKYSMSFLFKTISKYLSIYKKCVYYVPNNIYKAYRNGWAHVFKQQFSFKI